MQVTKEPASDVRFRATEPWPDSTDKAFIPVGVCQGYAPTH
jgi:hypothetical protein